MGGVLFQSSIMPCLLRIVHYFWKIFDLWFGVNNYGTAIYLPLSFPVYHLYFVVVRQEEWKEKRSTDSQKSNRSEQIHVICAVSSGSWDESWGCWELTYHSVEVSFHSQRAPQTSNPCPLQIWSSHPLYALLWTSGLWNKVPNPRELLDSLWSQTLKEVSKVALQSPSLEHQYLSAVLSFFEVNAVL